MNLSHLGIVGLLDSVKKHTVLKQEYKLLKDPLWLLFHLIVDKK